MKFKKEYLIIFLVIIGLSVYIYTRTSDRMNYELPSIPSIKSGQVTKIVIENQNDRIRLDRGVDGWFAGERGYPVKVESIESILTALDELRVTDLVSESENYTRYDLDQESAILVKAWVGGQPVRSFRVGKTASTFRNAYLKLDDDPRIYLSETNLHATFNKDLTSFQDKTILRFQKNELQSIELHGPEQDLTLTRQPNQNATTEDSGSHPEDWVWKTEADQVLGPAAIETLLDALDKLKCSAYLEDLNKQDLKDPDYSTRLLGQSTTGLNLFLKPLDENATEYRGTSLDSDFPFILPKYMGEDIVESIQALLEKAATE